MVLQGQSKPVSNEVVRERLSQEGGWVVMADGLRGASSRQRSPGEPGNSAVLHYRKAKPAQDCPGILCFPQRSHHFFTWLPRAGPRQRGEWARFNTEPWGHPFKPAPHLFSSCRSI